MDCALRSESVSGQYCDELDPDWKLEALRRQQLFQSLLSLLSVQYEWPSQAEARGQPADNRILQPERERLLVSSHCILHFQPATFASIPIMATARISPARIASRPRYNL